MDEYDVIVVGAGPAGCIAAKTAAGKGLKTILLEEHPQVGLPEHCMGLVAAPKESPVMQVIASAGERVVLTRISKRRIYTPDGDVIDKDFGGVDVIVVERNLLDVILAEQAADTGAKVVVNTRVTGIIRENGTVKGVKTNSNSMPEINGKIVIAADGIRSLLKGIPSWEGLTRSDQEVASGLKWHLSGVKEVEADILELHLGSFSQRGFATVAPIGKKGSCLTDVLNMKEMDTIQAGKWAISDKFRDCAILRMTGFSHPVPMGVMLPKRVKDGLMLVGDAGGFLGIDAAVSLGQVAGDVAGKAIEKGDLTEKGLEEYEEISHKIGQYEFTYGAQFHNLDQFSGHTDSEIQEIFENGISI